MRRLRAWVSWDNMWTGLYVAFIGVMVATLFVALWLLFSDLFNPPPTVYERIEECVAMEVYTRAECVVIESNR
jgi:hypothetical protein